MNSDIKIKYISILFFLFLLLSCGKKNKNNTTSTNSGILTASVSEASPNTFSADYGKAVYSKTVDSNMTQFALYVEGDETKNDRSIYLYVVLENEEIQPGTYIIKRPALHAAFFYENYTASTVTTWQAPNTTTADTNVIYGSITFNEIGTRLKGSFNFDAEKDGGSSLRTVTDGKFDVPLSRTGF